MGCCSKEEEGALHHGDSLSLGMSSDPLHGEDGCCASCCPCCVSTLTTVNMISVAVVTLFIAASLVTFAVYSGFSSSFNN